MPKMLFVNLPVKDLAAATSFYEAIGFEKNAQFSNEQASSMVWSEAITFQLMARDYYQTFTSRPIADAHETSAALFALSRDSRDEVDAMVEAAARAGGTADIRDPKDMGFLYVSTFADPDGNVFEPAWMDMSAMQDA